MFSLQWNIENIIASLFVSVFATILAEVFVHSVEHLKKPHFFVDFLIFSSNITKSSARALVLSHLFKGGIFCFYSALSSSIYSSSSSKSKSSKSEGTFCVCLGLRIRK